MADFRHLEEATNTMIYREEAFGAQYNADAFRPLDNFTDVSRHAPSKRNYSYVILQGSSTDITDLDTSAPGNANLDFFKQQVFISSQNMVAAARNILLNYPGVKKVLILDKIPRFDPETVDPTQLKSKLSEYGNRVFRDELEKCDVKNKISIASHILPEQISQDIYGHPARQGYDGIHPYGQDGRNFLTRSLCNRFQTFLGDCSREHHNHVIPSRRTDTLASTTFPSSSSRSPSSTTSAPRSSLSGGDCAPSRRNKAPTVVIEIEPEIQANYSVPVFNYFSVLGN